MRADGGAAADRHARLAGLDPAHGATTHRDARLFDHVPAAAHDVVRSLLLLANDDLLRRSAMAHDGTAFRFGAGHRRHGAAAAQFDAGLLADAAIANARVVVAAFCFHADADVGFRLRVRGRSALTVAG